MADEIEISQIHLDPELPLVEVKPHNLNARERKALLQMLRRECADSAFDQFAAVLERELAAFVFRREQIQDNDVTPAQARKHCRDIAKATRRLRSAWKKAPTESLRLLDFNFQLQRYLDAPPGRNETVQFHRNLTAVFSDVSAPFFMNLEKSMDTLIEVGERAATPSKKQAAGGRPLNPPLIFFLRSIAQAFVSILGQTPSITRTGPFSQTVRWALDLVSNGDQVKSVPKHIKRAVEEISKGSKS